ncbi:MAG: DUF5616 domain-containing protein [Desulfurococcales archaeon]|nr:DUF5616 domain-containing protein [Desulfurococcales archaeon]
MYRCVHSIEYSKIINSRKVRNTRNSKLAIDLLNTVSTIYAAKKGYPVLKCTDGFTRDILSSRLKIRNIGPELEEMLPVMNQILETVEPQEVVMVIDKPIPWSARLARKIREFEWSVPVETLVGRCDSELIKLGGKGFYIASSDIVILQAINKAIDLPGLYIEVFMEGLPKACDLEKMTPVWKKKIFL